jgi:competence protein ComEC
VKGANRIDGLLLSHGDSLHIGGAAPLLQDFVPRVLIDNRFGDRSSVHRQLRRTFATRKISPTMLTAGDTFQLAPRTIAKILFPVPGLSAATADDEALVVQLIIAGRTRVLFESDSGYATENALLASGSDLHSDMIIKGQHHSGKSGAPEFLDAVKPRLIVATSRDFPESERVPDQWADVVRARGIKLFRQDQTGAVEIGVFANRWEARAYVSGEIFAAPAGE